MPYRINSLYTSILNGIQLSMGSAVLNQHQYISYTLAQMQIENLTLHSFNLENILDAPKNICNNSKSKVWKSNITIDNTMRYYVSHHEAFVTWIKDNE